MRLLLFGFRQLRNQLFLLLGQRRGGDGGEQRAGVVELALFDEDVGRMQADGLLFEAGLQTFLQCAPDFERLVPVGVFQVVERFA